MDKEEIITNETTNTRVGWTPYNGRKVKGVPIRTILRGKTVMQDGKITGKLGFGPSLQPTGEEFLAEWWPSSAKLVFNKQWNQGCHCHDYRQALEMIERAYVKPQQPKAETGLDFTRSNSQESS